MHSQISSGALFSQVSREFFAEIFSTSIHMQDLDFGIQMHPDPSFILLVGLKGFAFCSDKEYSREIGVVISVGDVILLVLLCLDWSGPPKVRMDFISKILCPLSFSNLLNRFPSLLPILT